jgi:Trk K+ transport system NAD-binding subunit
MTIERDRPTQAGEPDESAAGNSTSRGSLVRRLIAQLRYRFDLYLARGPLIVIGYLALIMIVIIFGAAILLTAFRLSGISGGGSVDFANAFWASMLRVLDPGTFSSDTNWATRIIELFVTISGILIAGALIGLIANAIDQQVDNLRKGRSSVLEHDHTLVLGWSPRLPAILSELVNANENRKHAAFVVLAQQPKDELEDELRRLVPNTKSTRVVCRTGDVGNAADLRMVNVEQARSVIVLSGDDGDAGVVKAVLALRSVDPTFERIRVVAELDDADHAATLRDLTDGRVATVRAEEVITRVAAQACHQIGLATVFRDLLDFDGDEIYFASVSELDGHTYREAVSAFDGASVIGLFRDRTVRLNPPPDEVFRVGDEVIAIAADDDKVIFTGFADDAALALSELVPFTEPQQHIALVGWSAVGSTVLRELDQFLTAGSIIDVLVDRAVYAPEEIAVPQCERCEVRVHAIASGAKALIDELGEHRYDKAIVLGYRRNMTPAQADARSMLMLLALHRAWAGDPRRPRMVAEMLDSSNVEIAQTTGVDDFIVSDELSSLMIAQVSERLELEAVFNELFDADGCFVSLRPAPLYAPIDQETTYASVVASAIARGDTAIGYRLGHEPPVLNPPKSTRLRLSDEDQVLVLAEYPAQAAPAVAAAAGGEADLSGV